MAVQNGARPHRPVTPRYGVFSVTGWPITRRYVARGSRKPRTTWYVSDDACCGAVVYATDNAAEARWERDRLNAGDRYFDRTQA